MNHKLGSLSANREMNVLCEIYDSGGTKSALWINQNYRNDIEGNIIDDLCQYRYLKWNEEDRTYSITAKGKTVVNDFYKGGDDE